VCKHCYHGLPDMLRGQVFVKIRHRDTEEGVGMQAQGDRYELRTRQGLNCRSLNVSPSDRARSSAAA
jgi:hypothetical protein